VDYAGPLATPGVKGLAPISVKLTNDIVETLRMTDELDALQKRGCTLEEFSSAGRAAETRAIRLQGELSKDDPRRSLLVNTFQAYQQVALAIARDGGHSNTQSTNALTAAAGIRKTMLLRILEGNMTENEKNLYRVWLRATQQ
jgi:hypothetical protein